MTPERERKLSTSQAIAYLKEKHGVSISTPTLSRYRCDPRFKDAGPRGIRCGPRRVFYRVADLDAWVNGVDAPAPEAVGV